MRENILIGGSAGQGPNILASLISKGLIDKGFFVFSSREYESRVRGGHNFNMITFSDEPVHSNSAKVDILIALDENTEGIHQERLNKNGIILKGSSDNIFYAGRIFKILELNFKILDSEIKKLDNYEQNLIHATEGYNSEKRKFLVENKRGEEKIKIMNGNEAISEGAILSGVEFYYSYPMTPATGVLTELSQKQKDGKHITIELEGEISCINAAIGSSIAGAKAMVGTSGGGFDLMTESLSLAGMAEVPLVIYLSQRPGPSTGLATYTGQGDLNVALHSGHGEFNRIVIAPGDPLEAIEKTSEIFYFTQRYKIPGILMSDKHLVESYYSFTGEPRVTYSEKSIKWPARYNSYESGENKIATEDPKIVNKNVENRILISKRLQEEIEKFQSFKLYGKKDSENLIISWGSTKGAILDAIKEKDCRFLQIIYLEPFSNKIKNELKNAKKIIVVENNGTSPLSSLITKKTGYLIDDKNKILKYDGRPFLFEELSNEIDRRIK
ncbi:2-oxoacid:acceptor oxidoreductase family protein [Candidatus Pacearchaeota archaeon]|nr:2-oxoacid:acceptor oxidoreductase family protein [Candidatus Pacearchaeota archaeon]